MNRRQIALGALLAGLLAAVAVYLYLQATPYTETIDHGPSPKPGPTRTWPPSTFCAGRG